MLTSLLVFSSIFLFTACSTTKEQVVKKLRTAYEIQKEKESYADLEKELKK